MKPNRDTGERVIERRDFLPRQESDNPFGDTAATPADDSAKQVQTKNQKDQDHAQAQ